MDGEKKCLSPEKLEQEKEVLVTRHIVWTWDKEIYRLIEGSEEARADQEPF
jgi:hypothetical protein